MLRNYLTIAYRNLLKSIGYSFINVIGMALGLACCFIILLYVQFELSYDDIHENKDHIYRYIPRTANDGEIKMQRWTPAGLAPFLASEFHEIKYVSRYTVWDSDPIIKDGDKTLPSQNLAAADSSFFNMFSFKLVRGNAASVMNKPLTILLSKSLAEAHFPNEDPVGKILRYGNKYDLEITGVFQDIPGNSHLQFSYITSFLSLPEFVKQYGTEAGKDFLTQFGSWNYSTYIYAPNVNVKEFEKRVTDKFNFRIGRNVAAKNAVNDWLQPIGEIHFTQGIRGEDSIISDKKTVFMFIGIAFMVLLIACFNFMNLSTAKALKRAKEVGMRKVMGAQRKQLIMQFLGESTLLVLLAFLTSVILVQLSLPFFNSLMDLRLQVSTQYFVSILVVTLVTGVVAGSYPAFYLSAFTPNKVLKGEKLSDRGHHFRKILTTFQFGIAMFLIIGTLVIIQQMQFMKNSSLGFEKDHIITFQLNNDVKNEWEPFKNTLLQSSAIRNVSASNNVPGSLIGHWTYKLPESLGEKHAGIITFIADEKTLDLFNISLKEGRNFSTENPADYQEAYIINEAAVKEFMLENPIGTTIQVMDGSHEPGKIIGVVKDFHFRSLHTAIEPLVIRMDNRNAWTASVKLAPGNIQESLAVVENAWKKFSPEFPFRFKFLDDSIDRLYRQEEKTSALIFAFSLLAIIVAIMGLVGLSSFMTEQRRKEISIRKVLGAEVKTIVVMLSRDFAKLLIIAFFIAAPLSWYSANEWLNDFAYKITLGPVLFISVGIGVLIFALATVGYQTLKAAMGNPASILREN